MKKKLRELYDYVSFLLQLTFSSGGIKRMISWGVRVLRNNSKKLRVPHSNRILFIVESD
jgi:hypothetical protein